jgi:hypothetical protein
MLGTIRRGPRELRPTGSPAPWQCNGERCLAVVWVDCETRDLYSVRAMVRYRRGISLPT